MAISDNPPTTLSDASPVEPSLELSVPASQESLFPTVIVRQTTAKDARSICAVGMRVFTSTFAHTCTAQQLEDYLSTSYSPAAITRDLQDPQKTTRVAVDESDHVVGFVMLTRGTSATVADVAALNLVDDLVAEIQRIYVDEAHHGKGVAQLLFRDVEALAAAEGFRHLWLGCFEENARSLRFYEKMGYRKVGRKYFDVGGDMQADWILLRDL